MAHAYKISEDGLELIKSYEGFRPVETVLVSGQKVIGYGHPYVLGEASLLTQQKAEDILKADLEPIEKAINYNVHAPLSQNQFDALASLVFNIGIDAFSESSVLHYLNNGQPLAAAAGFDEWRKSIIAEKTYVIDALVRRRTAEKALFLGPATGIVAAPRYEIPAMHDDTVKSGADDIEVFSTSDEDGFVDQAPYEETPVKEDTVKEDAVKEDTVKEDRGAEAPAAALMLSEQVAAPQIYEETVDNVIEMRPESEFDVVTESEVEPKEVEPKEVEPKEVRSEEVEPKAVSIREEETQDDDLSPIAVAAADVSERLDNLMEETGIETEMQISEEEMGGIENTDFEHVNDDNAFEETAPSVAHDTISEPEVEAPEPMHPEPMHPEPMYNESELAETEVEPKQMKPKSKAGKKYKTKGAGAFWTSLIVGLSLIGGSLWKMKFSPATNLGEMGAFLAPVVLLVGAMMIMGGMLYMVKAQLRR